MKHSTLPPSPLTAYCTASLEIMGGPERRMASQGPSEPQVYLPRPHHSPGPLTIHIEWHLPLSHPNPRDNGSAGVGACIGLRH